MGIDGQGRVEGLKRPSVLETMDRRFLVVLRCAIYMLLGFIMSCARVLGQGAPLGMALVAASPPSLSGVFALLGAALG